MLGRLALLRLPHLMIRALSVLLMDVSPLQHVPFVPLKPIVAANLLLTPFRTQNVPPPMSAYQLSVQSVAIPPSSSRIPVHVSFAGDADIITILWESGHVETHLLNTRLGPGRGKVMQPVLLRSFDIPADLGLSVRQVCYLDASKSLLLGTRELGSDLLIIADAADEKNITFDLVSLPSRNGHLIPTDPGVAWQSLAGEIFSSTSLSTLLRPRHNLQFSRHSYANIKIGC